MMINRFLPILISICLLLVSGVSDARRHKTYLVKKGDSPAKVANKFGVPYEELLRYNNIPPGGSFRAGATVTIPFPGEVTGSNYVVKSGDSVAKVADFHGISQKDLRAANGLSPKQSLKLGQKLRIPHILRNGALKGHVVRKGDTIGSIAKKHKISINALMAENKLGKNSKLQRGRTLIIPDEQDDLGSYKSQKRKTGEVSSGKKVKNGVLHTVQPGQSLWLIARAYNLSGQRIADANRISAQKPLSAGQKILLPGAKKVIPVKASGTVSGAIRFISLWNDEKATLRLVSKSGKVNNRSRKVLSLLAGPKRKVKNIKTFHPRLILMLQRVADHFPGHSIEIISGYRPYKGTGKISKHNQGRAIDFHVRGISNKILYDFVKTLPKIGAGYYPNCAFIHMDVREKTTLWTDHSSSGE